MIEDQRLGPTLSLRDVFPPSQIEANDRRDPKGARARESGRERNLFQEATCTHEVVDEYGTQGQGDASHR